MSFDELFNPGARHLQDELEAERLLPVPIPVDSKDTNRLLDLGVTMPGLDGVDRDVSRKAKADEDGGPAAADPPPFNTCTSP